MSIRSVRSASTTDPALEIRITEEARSRPKSLLQAWLRPLVAERLIICVEALLVVISGVGCAAGYHLATNGAVGNVNLYAAASTLVAVNFTLLTVVQHGYRLKAIVQLPRAFRMTFATWTGVFSALLAIAFTMKVSDEFSRGTMISFYLVGLTALLIWKAFAAHWTANALRTGAFANTRAIMIAESGLPQSSNAMEDLGQHGYRVTRIMEISSKQLASPLLPSAIAPRLDEMIAYAKENRIEHAFVLINWNRQSAIDNVLNALKILPISIHLMPDESAARFLRHPLVQTGNTWTAEISRAPLSRNERMLKRVIDISGASVALLIFAPVMLSTALLIKLTSKGPVFFRQTRNGFNGGRFKIIKFRTMSVIEDGPTIVQAQKNDPRVTSAGKWLRKTSIDELPQLFNVLKGEMSLVGPRPHAAAHNTQYEQIISNYAFRHHVKPGITGWAQVNGYRGETIALEQMEKRVEFDLWYINNWSLRLDMGIIARTINITFRTTNAH